MMMRRGKPKSSESFTYGIIPTHDVTLPRNRTKAITYFPKNPRIYTLQILCMKNSCFRMLYFFPVVFSNLTQEDAPSLGTIF
jgi:hypothetical protein